jgi:hypothetical protein
MARVRRTTRRRVGKARKTRDINSKTRAMRACPRVFFWCGRTRGHGAIEIESAVSTRLSGDRYGDRSPPYGVTSRGIRLQASRLRPLAQQVVMSAGRRHQRRLVGVVARELQDRHVEIEQKRAPGVVADQTLGPEEAGDARERR